MVKLFIYSIIGIKNITIYNEDGKFYNGFIKYMFSLPFQDAKLIQITNTHDKLIILSNDKYENYKRNNILNFHINDVYDKNTLMLLDLKIDDICIKNVYFSYIYNDECTFKNVLLFNDIAYNNDTNLNVKIIYNKQKSTLNIKLNEITDLKFKDFSEYVIHLLNKVE